MVHETAVEWAGDADKSQLELLAGDAALRNVVVGWADLPDAVRAGISAMVNATGA